MTKAAHTCVSTLAGACCAAGIHRSPRSLRPAIGVAAIFCLAGAGTSCGAIAPGPSTHTLTRSTATSRARSLQQPTPSASKPPPHRIKTHARWSDTVLVDAIRAQQQVNAATCRQASAHERSRTPFGTDPGVVFECTLKLTGEPLAAYDVQALPDGCFVAERHRPGRAVYGC